MKSSLRLLGVLLLIAAGGAAWLSIQDRVSPLAMNVVEIEGQLGAPLWPVLAVFGAIALVLGRPSKRKMMRPEDTRPRSRPSGAPRGPSSSAPRRPPTGQARPGTPGAAPSSHDGWMADVERRIGATEWGAGVGVELHPERQVPLEMRLYRQTPEQARRSVGLFARLLSEIPQPARVRIRFTDCMAAPVPRPKQVTGCFRQHFPADAFRAVGSPDQVDVIFSTPDPRWV